MNRSIRIVVAALGGEGGGVLAGWIAQMASRAGYYSQSTSVPGVAQRTGATIYYVEIFPRDEAQQAGKAPVMSMFPTPGDVDVVVCSEIVEAGRMIQRGFVTPDRTTLVASTHRSYAISEKIVMGDGTVDDQAIVGVARDKAKKFVGFDMLKTAREFDSVINAVLFGALARTGALPFSREDYEQTIEEGGIAVQGNLRSFAAGFDLAQPAGDAVQICQPPVAGDTDFELPQATTATGQALLARVKQFPASVWEIAYLGVCKLVDYQDQAYAHLYLDRLQSLKLDAGDLPVHEQVLRETARFLALWMAFEDLARVAQIKTRGQRFEKFRQEVKAAPGQQVAMVEYLHPRLEELCGAMPVAMGQFVLGSRVLSRLAAVFTGPRTIRTDTVHGYLMLYLMSGLRRIRRRSLIYHHEQNSIEQWLSAVRTAVALDPQLALELAQCGRLIKGYSSTRERGNANLQKILAVCPSIPGTAAADVARLREAALADDEGLALNAVVQQITG